MSFKRYTKAESFEAITHSEKDEKNRPVSVIDPKQDPGTKSRPR